MFGIDAATPRWVDRIRSGVFPTGQAGLHSGQPGLGGEPEFAQRAADRSAALAFDRRIIAQMIWIDHGRRAASPASEFRHDLQHFQGRVTQ
jgi:hypothetical protein